MSEFTVREYSDINRARNKRLHKDVDWSGADWSNAMGGESGEAQNIVKKLRRHETGVDVSNYDNTPPVPELVAALASELADVVGYADLLADHYGIDLTVAIREKFNLISEKKGVPERLP